MRLYLASHRASDRFPRLIAMAGPGAKALVVPNAADAIPPAARAAYARDVHDPVRHFQDHGIAAATLDLRAFFGRPGAIDAALAGVDLVWVTGGNTFLLRRAMRQSGFDAAVARLVRAAALIYAGWSAGAVVAGPTLRGVELVDDPHALAEGYDPAPVWDGLNLVPFTPVPHVDSDHPESAAAARVVARLQAQGTPFRALRDGEAFIQEGATAPEP